MQNYTLLFCIILTVLSCTKNDDNAPSLDGECIGITDYAPPAVFNIELVDSEGNNLIQNGFYHQDSIITKLNNEDFNYQTLRSQETQDLDTLLVISPIGNEGDNRWLITLSEKDIDTLDFSMSNRELKTISDGVLYCGNRFLLNSASYNGRPIEFERSTSENFLRIPIKVTKTME